MNSTTLYLEVKKRCIFYNFYTVHIFYKYSLGNKKIY